MNTAIFHIVGGDAFFSGFLTVAAGAVVIGVSGRERRRSGSAVILIGWVLIVASATAHPMVAYAFLACLSIRVMTARPSPTTPVSAEHPRETADLPKRVPLMFRPCPMLCTVAIAAMVFEIFMYHPGQIRVSEQRPIVVIGDSLSAGMNAGVDIPWPMCLDEMTSVKVSNNAQAGATCQSAIKQLDPLPKQCVVIVEIGGNDLLGGRSASEFRADLDALLTEVQSPEREVVMFELPLPPFCNGYGYAQRQLADKHNVSLIPRRLLASVLFTKDATLDSIHLSNAGHRQLAERVAAILLLDNLE
jgi:acyl-CoA thioesterase-1